MIKLEFKISTVVLSSLFFGFLLGVLIMASLMSEKLSFEKIELNQKINELKVKNTELQGKVDSDLRLLKEIRRKQK